jgi:nitric oxide reductase activation protein
MPELLDISRRLRDIFADEADLLDDFGLERSLACDEMDWLATGPGISPESLRQAVDQILQSSHDDESAKRRGGLRPGWGLNLRPEEMFRPIDTVVKAAHDPAAHAEYARRVARAARLLRQYFEGLGLGMRPDRMRVRGRQLDRTRIRDLVLKADPRMLVARRVERLTDLFLGVLIDCSGSMMGDRIEKARLFGTLLAEAMKGLPGVDLRLFGFEHHVIHDAGDARRCAVHTLKAGGGNNDAAALWHAYRVARNSRRKAKLLVMISDGLPTECSVAALRALVARLSRKGYCCAQVAVQPISEICFPHYIVLNDANFDASVRQFGSVVMRLVGQTLGKG